MKTFKYNRRCKLCRPAYKNCIEKSKEQIWNKEEEWDIIEPLDICRDCTHIYEGFKKAAGKNVLVQSINIINMAIGDSCNICSVMEHYYNTMYRTLRERRPFCNSCKNWIANGMMKRDF